MWWRVISIIVAVGVLVSLITLWQGEWGPEVFGSSGYITLSTQEEYNKFMVEVTRPGIEIRYLELRENRYQPVWNDQPPTLVSALPIEVEYSVRYSKNVTFGYGDRWLDEETVTIYREVPTIIIVLLGFGLAGILWLLPGGLYEKEVKNGTDKEIGRGPGKRVGTSKA